MENYINLGNCISEDYDRYCQNPDNTYFHIHPHFEFLFLFEPIKSDNIIALEHIMIDFPCAIIISPYIPHFANPMEYSGKYKKSLIYYNIEEATLKDLPVSLQNFMDGKIASIFNLTEVKRMFENLTQILKEATSVEEKERLLEFIFFSLTNENLNIPTIPVVGSPSNYIYKVILYIIDNLNYKHTINSISKHFFVSPDKLRKDFVKNMQIPIGEFIMKMKLSRAKMFLKNSKLNIAEISELCGFDSESYFYKFFKSYTGITPLNYRLEPKQ